MNTNFFLKKAAKLWLLSLLLMAPTQASAKVIFVDTNGDGIVNITDVTFLINYLLEGSSAVNGTGDYLSARDYGAVGDGETDDTAALETLFADAAELQKAAYIPAGTYMIRRPLKIKSGMEIYGDGVNSVIKKYRAYWHKIVSATSKGQTVIPLDGIDGYHVGDHCYVTSTASTTSAAARHCSFGEITAIDSINKTVTFKSAYHAGAPETYADGLVKAHAKGCYLSTSFPIMRSWSFMDECIGVYIHDICLDGNRQTDEPMEWTNACVHFDAYGSAMEGIAYNHHSYNHVIERCKLINSSFDAVSDQGEGRLFVNNCVITNSAMHGVHMGTTFANAVISNNTMTGNGTRGAGVFFCQDVTNVVIDNNQISSFNHGCSDEEYGTRAQYTIIRNNVFNNITSYVFDFLKATTSVRGGGLQISNNNIKNLKAPLFNGRYLDDVILSNNKVTSVSSAPSNMVTVTNSSNVIIVGNTLPSGSSVSDPVDSTGTTNLVQASNSWN
ncbi:MAG: right-handed parallel beta-helix repeat-containing protein [Muribaculaceae bacterium]|nr:right-handed parallel beta-helix repeat-containing protein [Muribaculaceae bacterium]